MPTNTRDDIKTYAVIALRKEGKKMREIAAELNMPIGTVTATINRYRAEGGTELGGPLPHSQRNCIGTHGFTRGVKPGTPMPRLYTIWCGMKSRCDRPSHHAYATYGGKGVKVCSQWTDFAVFHAWAVSSGYADDLSIDRIDASGDYEPNNCRWVTRSENSRRRWDNYTPEQRSAMAREIMKKYLERKRQCCA